MDFESSFQRITSPKPTVRVMGDGFEGKCAGNMYPTSLKHEAFYTGRRVPHNAEGSLTVGQSFKFAVPFALCQKGLRQGRSEKPRPTPEKSPQMRTDTWNAHALSCRNIATISEKQRMFLSCQDWLAEGARFELADPLRGLQFSRLARSAAPSPLHTLFASTRGAFIIALGEGKCTSKSSTLFLSVPSHPCNDATPPVS